MKKLYNAAAIYMILGLAGGLFYREFGKGFDFDGFTQLAVVHTHLLTLGMLFFLLVLALEKAFTLSKSKWFNLFFWHYNAGLVLSATMMTINGIITLQGGTSNGMMAGIAGLGHIIITVGLIFLFIALRQRLFTKTAVS